MRCVLLIGTQRSVEDRWRKDENPSSRPSSHVLILCVTFVQGGWQVFDEVLLHGAAGLTGRCSLLIPLIHLPVLAVFTVSEQWPVPLRSV